MGYSKTIYIINDDNEFYTQDELADILETLEQDDKVAVYKLESTKK